MGPKNGSFFWGGGNGGLNLRFSTTPKGYFRSRNRVVWRILRHNRWARLGCSHSQAAPPAPPPPKKITESLSAEGREITHAQKRNPCIDLDIILRDVRYPRRNKLHKFWWPSVKVYSGGGGQISPRLLHRLSSTPFQHSGTTVVVTASTVRKASCGT